jgi:hypothetical protein
MTIPIGCFAEALICGTELNLPLEGQLEKEKRRNSAVDSAQYVVPQLACFEGNIEDLDFFNATPYITPRAAFKALRL